MSVMNFQAIEMKKHCWLHSYHPHGISRQLIFAMNYLSSFPLEINCDLWKSAMWI
jgi:hypothetical protein